MNLMALKSATVWIHLLSLIGTFGALLFYQMGLRRTQRDDLDHARRLSRVCNLLISIGLLTGLVAYYLNMKISGGGMPSRFHSTVGLKVVLFLGVGAALGIGSSMHRKGKIEVANTLRWAALTMLALAAFFGEWL